jgi:hypothetical protein
MVKKGEGGLAAYDYWERIGDRGTQQQGMVIVECH